MFRYNFSFKKTFLFGFDIPFLNVLNIPEIWKSRQNTNQELLSTETGTDRQLLMSQYWVLLLSRLPEKSLNIQKKYWRLCPHCPPCIIRTKTSEDQLTCHVNVILVRSRTKVEVLLAYVISPLDAFISIVDKSTQDANLSKTYP